jgi:agmatine deiminase
VFERLSRSTDAQGRAFEIVKLHHPGPLLMTAEEARSVDTIQGSEPRQPGARLAGSYINHYICNGAVIVPLLDSARNQTAMEVLARAYPGRAMKGIDAREILLGGGNIHCIVQQQPAASG